MKRIIVFLLGIFCICLITACAIGRTYNYSNAWPSLSYSSAKKVTIAVHDQRNYVIKGQKSESYAGMLRGGYGNPWNVNTENNESLSDVMANNICSGLNNAGIKASKVLTKYTDSKSSILNTMVTTSKDNDRLIILTILDWYTDTYKDTTLYAHLVVEVYDGEKNNISKYEFKEERNLGYGIPYNTAPNAFKNIISTIFNKTEIKSSLTTD